MLDQPVSIAYQEPFGKWRMTDAVGLGGPLPRVGALTYDRGNVGFVEEKVGRVTHGKAESHVIFGEVLDPEITWVELTLYEEGAKPQRATVKDGIWRVLVPPEAQNTWFDLRAGNAGGLRFAVSVGQGSTQRHDLDPAITPLVEYLDVQQGIQLQYPATAPVPRIGPDGRLKILFSSWTVTAERKARDGRQELVEASGAKVVEKGTRLLGNRQAGYLLESSPEKDGQGSTYLARYLVLTDRSRWETTCSAPRLYSTDIWKKHLEPVCDRVLNTIRLDGM